MAERVARGVYAKNGWWRIVADDDDGKGRYDTKGGARMRAVEWSELEPDEIDSRLKDARAAIEAMMEPSDAMLERGKKASGLIPLHEVWRVMIKEALG